MMIKRWAIIKDGVIDNCFSATEELAQSAHPGCVEVTEDRYGRGDLYVGGVFEKRGRDFAKERVDAIHNVQDLLKRTQWVTDQDNLLTPQERTTWRQWRNSVRALLRNNNLNSDTPIPEAPGPLDEA